MSKILGIDYGEVRTGVAITDSLKMIASPYKTISEKNNNKLIEKILKILEEEEVEKVIVGLPFSMNGEDTDRTKKTRNFINKLSSTIDLPVKPIDERLSSEEAKDILKKQGVKTGHEKEKVDKTAASIILRRYLDENK